MIVFFSGFFFLLTTCIIYSVFKTILYKAVHRELQTDSVILCTNNGLEIALVYFVFVDFPVFSYRKLMDFCIKDTNIDFIK